MVEFDGKIAAIDHRIETLFKNDGLCMKIEKIPGIGKLTATAILAAVGDGHEFRNGRQMAAWLGLSPHDACRRNLSETYNDSSWNTLVLSKFFMSASDQRNAVGLLWMCCNHGHHSPQTPAIIEP